jgi:GNAT superfamily N-acetyltransferase
MLDKSIEYKNIIMRIDRDAFDSSEPELPQGFSFCHFTPRNVDDWSRIETSVLEFASEKLAKSYFEATFLPCEEELRKRCLFVLNAEGVPVATANAWYVDSDLGYQALLHWVAVCPEYQGRGIGKAVVKKALSVFSRLDEGHSVWLHTQTWSHVAIRMYHSLGFNLVRKDELKNCKNDFSTAVEVLRTVMDECYVNELVNTAV